MAMAGKKNSCFLARPENNFESKQTYFSYSPNKGFHPPEFQEKLFFTRNWVGGFYWDCLLNARELLIVTLYDSTVALLDQSSWIYMPGFPL